MEARLSSVLFLIACVPSIFGFAVPAPRGIGSSMESSYEAAEVSVENPGLLILNGPVERSEYEPVESEVESVEPAEPSIESEYEPVESSDVVAQGGGGTGQTAAGQAPANGGGPPVGAGAGIILGGGTSPSRAGQGGNPHQISSSNSGRAAGVAVAVGACFLVVVAVGVAAYIIRQRRRTRNEPERLQ